MTGTEDIRIAVVVGLACAGALFFILGTVGLLRLPDFFSRIHAATKCDTVGAGLLLAALAVLNGAQPATAKIVVLAGLVLLSSPTTGHALARAAHRTGLVPYHAEKE